jgi:hypothetical protein
MDMDTDTAPVVYTRTAAKRTLINIPAEEKTHRLNIPKVRMKKAVLQFQTLCLPNPKHLNPIPMDLLLPHFFTYLVNRCGHLSYHVGQLPVENFCNSDPADHTDRMQSPKVIT